MLFLAWIFSLMFLSVSCFLPFSEQTDTSLGLFSLRQTRGRARACVRACVCVYTGLLFVLCAITDALPCSLHMHRTLALPWRSNSQTPSPTHPHVAVSAWRWVDWNTDCTEGIQVQEIRASSTQIHFLLLQSTVFPVRMTGTQHGFRVTSTTPLWFNKLDYQNGVGFWYFIQCVWSG